MDLRYQTTTNPTAPDDLLDTFDLDDVVVQERSLPPYIGGLTQSAYQQTEEGMVDVESIDIYMNDEPENDHQALDDLYHEVIHAAQYDDLDGRVYEPEELEALDLLHEGQSAANADQSSYRDAMMVYETFLQEVEHGKSPAEALEAVSEQYQMFAIELEEGETPVKEYLAIDEDDGIEEDVAAYVSSVYGDEVADIEEIDYSEMDTAKIADHLVSVQESIDMAYDELATDAYDLPKAAR
ncbi:MAG: hypothetical protein MUP66_00660 [Candidatus Nanohaloarchaeota archaeon QJJ-5]|nr:hypothetical protein [Candidatus Nanohaloarchaeota archaeon QJJ-5]